MELDYEISAANQLGDVFSHANISAIGGNITTADEGIERVVSIVVPIIFGLIVVIGFIGM